MHLRLDPPMVHTVVDIVKIFFLSLSYEGWQHRCFMPEGGRVSKLENTFEFVEVLDYLKKESGVVKPLQWDA